MRNLLSALLALVLLAVSLPLWAQRVIVISDLNGRYGSTVYNDRVSQAIQVVIGLKPDLVILAGDLIAGQRIPLLTQAEVDAMWTAFNKVVADPLTQAGIPMMVTPGNHDASSQPVFSLERERFDVQWNKYPLNIPLLPGSEWPKRYAMMLGDTLLISVDGSNVGKLDSKDHALIESSLSSQKSKPAHTIIASHLPLWPYAQGREREVLNDPRLAELMSRNQVDFFISGHHHVFYAGVDEHGTTHLANGALGGNARKLVGRNQREPFSFTLLDLCPEGYSISARVDPDFQTDLDISSLPESIKGPLGRLPRMDLSEHYSGKDCRP